MIDYSTVTKWVKQINDGHEEPAESDLCDRPRSGRPFSAYSFANIDQADALIKENRRITINELSESLGVSAGSADLLWKYLRQCFSTFESTIRTCLFCKNFIRTNKHYVTGRFCFSTCLISRDFVFFLAT